MTNPDAQSGTNDAWEDPMGDIQRMVAAAEAGDLDLSPRPERRFILRWGWIRVGRFNLGWWSPWEWHPFSIREGFRGKRVLGWVVDAWTT